MSRAHRARPHPRALSLRTLSRLLVPSMLTLAMVASPEVLDDTRAAPAPPAGVGG